MKATEPGQVIGRALEDFDGTQSIIDSSDKEFQVIQGQLKQGKKIEEIDLSKIDFSESETTGEGKIIATLERGMYLGDRTNSLAENISNSYSAFSQSFMFKAWMLALVGVVLVGVALNNLKKKFKET